MDAVVIIPARYESRRFHGKPLVDILGTSLIKRTWIQCLKAFDRDQIYVATDDERIRKHCEDNFMQYIMTSEDCLTGTDRIAEAYKRLGKRYETIINVQGDEPIIPPKDILKIAEAHSKDPKSVCCGFSEVKEEEAFRSTTIVKVVFDYDNYLLYASRAAIPTNKNLGFDKSWWQVCVYAFSPESLESFVGSTKTRLEQMEDVELLRFLELGYKIKMVHLSGFSMSVDVPEDAEKVKEFLRRA